MAVIRPAGAWRRHAKPLVLVMLLPVLANALGISGYFNIDSVVQSIGLGQNLKPGLLSGTMGTIDPSVAYLVQPIGYLAANDWLHGVIPWWNPYAGVGMPLAAETQTEAFFLPFVLLLHFNSGWEVLRVILQILCGAFGYLLFVELGLAIAAAVLGAALFSFSPEFILCPSAPIAPLPFLPLLLLGIEKSAKAAVKGQPSGWSLIAIACAYSIYAGNLEVAYFDGLLAGLWSIWRFFTLPNNAKLRFAIILGVSLGLAIGLSAPLLWPATDYLKIAYIQGHADIFSWITLGSPKWPLQIMPDIYGRFSSPPPPSLASAFGGIERVPGWVGLPVLALAITSLVRLRDRAVLRYMLFVWISLWEARYIGVGPVIWLVNLVPGIAATDSTRYSGPAVDFAVYTLAAFGTNDLMRLPRARLREIGLMILALCIVLAMAILPALGFIKDWYSCKPDDMYVAMGSFAGDALILGLLCLVMRRPRYIKNLVGLMLAGPFLTYMLPQLAGLRAGDIDTAPIRYLQQHIGMERMISLGPLGVGFPTRYGIASINYFALPVARLWTDYIASTLYPGADLAYYSAGRNQEASLMANLPTYESIGVRYAVAYGDDRYFWTRQSHIIDNRTIYTAQNLGPGEPDLTGIIPAAQALPSVAAASILIGTYGHATGPLDATFCAGGNCVSAMADTATAIDNLPIYFTFSSPLMVALGEDISFRFKHSVGTKLAVWMGKSAKGAETASIDLIGSYSGAEPKLVFQDASALIFELPDPAPYIQTADSLCATSVIDRQRIETECAKPTSLIRREMFFPGWHAAINGRPVVLTQDGLFQSISVPAGRASIRFTYLPPHIRMACLIAIMALLILFGLEVFTRARSMRLS